VYYTEGGFGDGSGGGGSRRHHWCPGGWFYSDYFSRVFLLARGRARFRG